MAKKPKRYHHRRVNNQRPRRGKTRLEILVEEALIKCNMSRTEAANRMDMLQTNFTRLLRGRCGLSVYLAVKLEKVLGIDAFELMKRELEDEVAFYRQAL